VSLNEQRPPSFAQKVHDESGGVIAVVVAVTTAVAADDAVAEPAELLAVTDTRIVKPTSPEPRRSVLPVAPPTAVHEPPLELQRCHW
jgi:hypothetical protein